MKSIKKWQNKEAKINLQRTGKKWKKILSTIQIIAKKKKNQIKITPSISQSAPSSSKKPSPPTPTSTTMTSWKEKIKTKVSSSKPSSISATLFISPPKSPDAADTSWIISFSSFQWLRCSSLPTQSPFSQQPFPTIKALSVLSLECF